MVSNRARLRKQAKKQRTKIRATLSQTTRDQVETWERLQLMLAELIRRHAAKGLYRGRLERTPRRPSISGRSTSRRPSNGGFTPRDLVVPTRVARGGPSSSEFLRGLVASRVLRESEAAQLQMFGVRSLPSALSAVQAFPAFFNGLDLPALQSRLARASPASLAAFGRAKKRIAEAGEQLRCGVRPGRPEDGDAIRATVAPISTPAESSESPLVHGPRIPGPSVAWPVKSQGARGTCVAFASVACMETPAGPRLSEQFLYFAIKTHSQDPWPAEDGTRLKYMQQALGNHGVCEEGEWRYEPEHVPGSVSQANHPPPGPQPTQAARHQASRRCNRGSPVLEIERAQMLYDRLRTAQYVAAEFAVFQLAGSPVTNWSSPEADATGVISEVPPTASGTSWEVVGGHAVCVVGYEPDAYAPGGGWFLFRNSWSGAWAADFSDPASGRVSTQAGFGQISAQQVERFGWTMWHA